MRVAGVALLAALALVAAGCGGSSSNESAADETTTVESTATDTTTEETTEETETVATETETVSSDVDEDALANLLGSEGCAELATVGMKFAEAMGASQGASGDLEDTQKYFEELADKAPEEIRDDFAVMAEAWTAIVEVYSDMGIELGETPTPEQIEKFSAAGEELAKRLDDGKFEEASTNISAWATENCSGNG